MSTSAMERCGQNEVTCAYGRKQGVAAARLRAPSPRTPRTNPKAHACRFGGMQSSQTFNLGQAFRMQLVELELKIENLRTAIEALRGSNASRTEIDRALSELARVKAERLRLMLRQVNFHTERGARQSLPISGPSDREAIAARLGNADG